MKKVTFRNQTKGEIDDFLDDEGLQCAPSQALIAVLVGELLHYTEEGRPLTPSVMYCRSIAEVIAPFPGAVKYEIGSAPLSPDSAKQILKLCAPLASNIWHIFIERSDAETLKFGVFKYPMLPTTAPLHEMLEITKGTHFAMVVRKTSASSIELRGAGSHHVSFLFSTVREGTADLAPLEKFATDCLSGLGVHSDGAFFADYFKRMLDKALTNCHGTILLCGESAALQAEANVKDATWLGPLDFWTAFQAYRAAGSSDSLLELQHLEELLNGMMNSDGMVAFDAAGRVLGYRFFYSNALGGGGIQQPTGGARRRAFEGVKALVGISVRSALLRSQDGNMLYAGGRQ